jgi:hypothetical protein
MNERMLARYGLLEQKKREAAKLEILIDNLRKDINYAMFPEVIKDMKIPSAEVLMHELAEKWRNYMGLVKEIENLDNELKIK